MHVHRHIFIALALLGVSIGSVGCDESLTSITGPTPNLVPTFSSIQAEIFNKGDSSGRAACVQCPQCDRRCSTDSILTRRVVQQPGECASRVKAGAVRVIPGDPENSYLIHKLEGRAGLSACGCRFPALRISRLDRSSSSGNGLS
jgi:hypothetical protein